MSIHKKLLEVQGKLKAPKNQRNNFGKYNYRSCEDILEAVKPLLVEQGLTIVIRDTIEVHLERVYLKATIALIDTETGEKVENSAIAREPNNKKGMDESQITGASSSYARKYALNGMFAIDDTKDGDSVNQGPNIAELKKLAKGKEKKIIEYYKVEKLENLSNNQIDEAISRLKGAKK